LVPLSVTLNGVLARILGYFVELGSFQGALRKSGGRYTDTFYGGNVAQRM